MKVSKIEIRQVNGECGIFTEILVDGHKLEGVRSFELKQGVGDSEPILSIDLNALNLSTDLQMLQVNQKGIGEIEGIKFKDSPRMLKFQAEQAPISQRAKQNYFEAFKMEHCFGFEQHPVLLA